MAPVSPAPRHGGSQTADSALLPGSSRADSICASSTAGISVPHFPQNRSHTFSPAPHSGQVSSRLAPHPRQNCRAMSFTLPHSAHWPSCSEERCSAGSSDCSTASCSALLNSRTDSNRSTLAASERPTRRNVRWSHQPPAQPAQPQFTGRGNAPLPVSCVGDNWPDSSRYTRPSPAGTPAALPRQ